ncbi:MAG: hypothetical protein R3Y56_07030, partial [Akkermansia sp.]
PTPEPTPEPEEIAEEEEVEEKEEEEEEELPPIQTAMPMPTQAQAQAFEREQKQQLTPMHDRQKKQYWDQIMTGDPLRIPDDIQEQAGLDDGEMDEEEKEQQLLSTVNRSWVVDHLNKNKQDVRQNWENIRSTLAKKYGVGDNEQELFYALSDEQMEGQRRQIANKIHQQSFEAGLRGDIVANTRSEMAELSDAERPRAIAIQQEAFRAGRQKHESMLPMAQQIAEGLPALVNTERDLLSPLSIDQKMKPLLEIKDELAALPKSERDYVYHLALQERQKMDDAAPAEGELDELSKAWRAFRRSSFNIGMDIGQGGAYVAAATLENMGDYLDKPLGSDLKGRSHRIDQRAQVLQELRDLAQLKSYPLIHEEDASLGEKIAHDVASSIPHALLAMSGGVGFGSLLFGGAGASIAEARQRAPEGEVNPQVAAGLIAGAAQAGITMAMGRIGSRVLEQSLSRFASAKGLGFKGYSLAALQTGASVSAESANMLLAGKLAQATDLGLHELAAQCQDTASNINWKAYGDNATDIELNIREAAANLPFLLIASGRMSLRQFRGKREILAQGDALRAWGIPEGKVQKLLKMRDIDQQSEALRIALRDSPRFGGSSVITFAMKTLRLLHQDKFKIFEQPEVVADFLQLPATHSYLKKQPARLVDASDKSSRNKLEKSYQQGKSPTLTEQGMALQLWDYWWQKANIIVPPSKRQPMNYDKRMERLENSYGRFRVHNYPTELQSSDGLIPNKLKRTGFIYRDAEQARRTVLSDRCDDIESLSYQYLLTSTSPSTLPQQGTDINKHIELGEKKRRQVLGRVAQCVMSMALGTPKEQAFAEFEQKFFRHYRNRKDPSREPEWLRGNKLPAYKILKTINTTDRDKLAAKGYPLEHYQAARICMGMESASQTLYHLLPMMDDFGACIARGMTPAQSYRHLLGRELGIDAKDFKPLPQEASDDAPLPSPDSQYLDKLKLLTGEEPEMQLGDAGQELWRMPTHLGQYTRWHSDKKAAIREYAWRMQQAFRPLMEEQNTTLRQLAAKPHFDREKDLPHEALQEFTGFDQLCIQALNDMHDMGSGLRASLLPGMVMGTSKLRNRHRKGAETKQYSLLQFKPEYLRNKDGHFYRADFKSMGTPYSLSRGRAHIYWRRLLDTHLLEPADAFSLLLTAGVVKESERSSLQELAPPTIVPMPAYGRKPQLTVKRDLINRTESRNEALAERLAELSADFQVAHINESTLPPSAKEWYRLIPFCPKEVDAPESYAINQLDSGRKLLRWINKTTANQLNERTDTWQHLRELDSQLRQHPLALHLQESVGHSSAESYHRAWAQQMGGHQAIDSPYTELWHLLTKPLEVWDKMDPERKADLAPLLEAQYQSKLRHSGKDANCPLDWESALLNLDAVLLDYPHIASYAEAIGHKGMVSRMTTLQDSLKQENTINYGSNLPLAWRGRGKPKTSQRISEPMALPAEMRDDPRVMPAIRLMDTMRAFIAHRPQDTPDGISWMGKLYGVGHRHLPQTDETWKPRRALEPLIRLFDDIKQQVGDDAGSITVADVKFTPLPEGMDYQALMHTGIYRNPNAPNEILRLMPGDFTASLLDARTPYVVRSRNGNYFDQRRAIRDVDELHKGIVNLDQHRLRMLQEHADATQESISTTMAKHLTAQILKLAPDNKDSASPSDEIINNSELLMRLAEDSGLCYELESKGLEQLTPPQLSLLSIIQDLMLIEYGPQPEQAYQRLCGKAKGIARSERLTRRLELCILDMQTRMAKIAQGINHQHPNKID